MKHLILTIAFLFTFVATPSVVLASTESDISTACSQAAANGGDIPAYCADQTKEDPITGGGGIIRKTINIISIFAGAVAVIIIIIAGFRFIISQGESAKLVQARQTIIYALVGLIVIVLSNTIILFVLSKL